LIGPSGCNSRSIINSARKKYEPDFEPKEEMLEMSDNEWEELTGEVFQQLFRKSAVKRTKFKGLKRNIEFLRK